MHEPPLAGGPSAQLEHIEAVAQLKEASAAVTTADFTVRLGEPRQQLAIPHQGLIQRELVYSSRGGTLNFVIPHTARQLLNGEVCNLGWS